MIMSQSSGIIPIQAGLLLKISEWNLLHEQNNREQLYDYLNIYIYNKFDKIKHIFIDKIF